MNPSTWDNVNHVFHVLMFAKYHKIGMFLYGRTIYQLFFLLYGTHEIVNCVHYVPIDK